MNMKLTSEVNFSLDFIQREEINFQIFAPNSFAYCNKFWDAIIIETI